jgi:hypothetical protein
VREPGAFSLRGLCLPAAADIFLELLEDYVYSNAYGEVV